MNHQKIARLSRIFFPNCPGQK